MRTKGALDKKKRKTRKDKKHKYRRNRMGNLVTYIPKRKKFDPLKVWWQEVKPMSKEGYNRFPKHLRPYVQKKVKPFIGKPILVESWQISSPEAIGQLAIETIGYPGIFNFLMPTHAKNSYHCSFKKKAIVRVVETEEELKAFVINTSKLGRYWFWEKRQKDLNINLPLKI